MKTAVNVYDPDIKLWYYDDMKYEDGSIDEAFTNNKIIADIAKVVRNMCPSIKMKIHAETYCNRTRPNYYVVYRLCRGDGDVAEGFGIKVEYMLCCDRTEQYRLNLLEYKPSGLRASCNELYLPARLQKMTDKRNGCYIDDHNKRFVCSRNDSDYICSIVDAIVTKNRREAGEVKFAEAEKQKALEEMAHNLVDCELLEVWPDIKKLVYDKLYRDLPEPQVVGAGKETVLIDGEYGRCLKIQFYSEYMCLRYLCGVTTDDAKYDYSALGLIMANMLERKIDYDKHILYKDKDLMFELITRICDAYRMCIKVRYDPWSNMSQELMRPGKIVE